MYEFFTIKFEEIIVKSEILVFTCAFGQMESIKSNVLIISDLSKNYKYIKLIYISELKVTATVYLIMMESFLSYVSQDTVENANKILEKTINADIIYQ